MNGRTDLADVTPPVCLMDPARLGRPGGLARSRAAGAALVALTAVALPVAAAGQQTQVITVAELEAAGGTMSVEVPPSPGAVTVEPVTRTFVLEAAAVDGFSAVVQQQVQDALQIVPGGLGFDVAGELERLRDALRRLGDAGATAAVGDGLALIVHDSYEIASDRVVHGDIAVLGGTLRLTGSVQGDVLLLNGTLQLDGAGRVEGDVLQVGGDLDLSGSAAVIAGEILSDLDFDLADQSDQAPAPSVSVQIHTPEADVASGRGRARQPAGFWTRMGRNFENAAEGLITTFFTFILLAVPGLLAVNRARGRMEVVSETVRRDFGRSFAMGIAAQILFFPILLVLFVFIITIAVIPFFLFITAAAAVMGYLAVAHGAGELLARRRYRSEWIERLRRPSSYYYLLSGLVVLLLPYAIGSVLWVFGGAAELARSTVFFVSCGGGWVLMTAGLGAVLLTRGGGRGVVVSRPDPGPDGTPAADPAAHFTDAAAATADPAYPAGAPSADAPDGDMDGYGDAWEPDADGDA